ncbi:hypothetical protein GCM10027028_60470 [Streptomyces sundarbansensis]
MAVALEGGRGSRQCPLALGVLDAQGWRSPSGATEDRNDERAEQIARTHQWRSPSRAAEDRNFAART